MLFTITTTASPATDLGYLLHKHPARLQTFELPFGSAHVCYPEAHAERCTAALLLDVDPVGLVWGRPGSFGDGALDQYVNDRPYAASSFLSVALARVFRSALSGSCKERPDLPERALPLQARLSVLPSRGGEGTLRSLFEPLGYTVDARAHALDDTYPDWGPSRYFTVTLSATKRLSELLTHVYVLVPVLDDDKHYYVGEDEVAKLLRYGEGWLIDHPERKLITRRYLKHRPSLARMAMARLHRDEAPLVEAVDAAARQEEALEEKLSLDEERRRAVVATLGKSGAKRVLDLGCGEGKLLRALLHVRQFEELVGVDVSLRSLEIAEGRLGLERLPERQRDRVRLLHGSLTYRDQRIAGFDAAAVVEVIEHLDPHRLGAFERALFEFARPATIVLTTPNREYNVRFGQLAAGALRHKDHRFEWTRAEFARWADDVSGRFGYQVRLVPIGPVDEMLGPPTQMAVFTR